MDTTTKPRLNQWRTVIVTHSMAAALLGALLLTRNHGELGSKMFETAAWTLFLLSLPPAAKSSIEHLAGGGGIRGAISAIVGALKKDSPTPIAATTETVATGEESA